MFKELFLGVAVLFIMKSAADKPSDPGPEEGSPLASHGVPQGGGGGGRSQVEKDRVQELLEERKKEEFKGHGSEEAEIQALQQAYDEWIEECNEAGDGDKPKMTDKVKAYGEMYNIKMTDLKVACSGAERRRATGRQKRTFMFATAGVWDKCIVPFVFDSTLPADWEAAVNESHAYFEKWTGFRFKYYDGNNSQWGLPHENYLNYRKGDGCASGVGNKGGNGQNISPCGTWSVATHEIGHALGMMHEHGTPASFQMLSSHFRYAQTVSHYDRNNLEDVHRQLEFYDMSSLMSYDDWMFNVNYGKTITANEADFDYLIGSDNEFYMFDELQQYHNCFDEFPDTCSAPLTCHMGGYKSVIDGKCSCRCPEGLDPATNCATRYVPEGPKSWPEGNFTLLKYAGEDCPADLSPGHMSRWNAKWTWTCCKDTPDLSSPGYQQGGIKYGHDMCTQTSSSGGEAWPPGRYCFLRHGGSCPTGFDEGKQELYGQDPEEANYTYGVLPDGEKGRFFEYFFCCRKDGNLDTPISLPLTTPFILYTSDSAGCQAVEGMDAVKQYYNSKSNETLYGGILEFSGTRPKGSFWSREMFNTQYCAYSPVTLDCGEIKTFTTETVHTITTPNYPANYPASKQCMWHFKSPEGTTMKIDFTDFEVSGESDTSCSSFVELKTYLPGAPGFMFCGHGYRKTHETASNYLTVKFVSSNAETHRGFSANITILRESDTCSTGDGKDTSYAGTVDYARESDKCYTGDGKDRSYAGTVDYARSFNPCIPWNDPTLVANCKINMFDVKVLDVDLSHNYCRNVVTGRMPWCYTNAERCVRENCDACSRDSCYNMFDDCPANSTVGADYCTANVHGEAHRGCMESCDRCSSPAPVAGSVHCSAPGDVTGISPVPAKTTYNVGDVVTYTCPTTETARTRTCTSEGTWTHLGYVCSGCPTGWSGISGRCYKWLGWREEMTVMEAKAACAALFSTAKLAILPSEDIMNKVFGLTKYDKHDNPFLWLGMTADENRVWSWDDGTPVTWAGWEAGKPNNYRNREDCADGQIAGTWNDRWCDATKTREVVCTYTPTAEFVCEDDLPNCATILEQTPDMCENQPDYAWVNCRKTCRVPDCPSSIVNCSVAEVDNAQRTHGMDTLELGQYVEHTCNDGYAQSGGDAKRACQPSGLTGSPLVCSDESTLTYELLGDRELMRRPTNKDRKYALVADRPTCRTKIPRSGKITAWTFYSNFAGSVTFQVWRHDASSAAKFDTTSFTLVGQNTISLTEENRRMTANIVAADQIEAQAGDVIGIYQDDYVISYQRCDEAIMPENSYWYQTVSSYATASEFVTNTSYDFKLDGNTCHIYSIRATIDPAE